MSKSELPKPQIKNHKAQTPQSQSPKIKSKKKSKYLGFPFLIVVVFLYIILSFFHPEITLKSLQATGKLFIKIVPVLLVLIIIMGIADYFSDPNLMKRLLGKGSGVKGWVIAIITGIISAGPIYLWFPFLKELKSKGMKNSLVAVFLYNRAIKIPLIPIIIYYFGFKFVIIMLIWMILASIIEGILMETICPSKPLEI